MTKSRRCKQCLRGRFCPVAQPPGQDSLREWQPTAVQRLPVQDRGSPLLADCHAVLFAAEVRLAGRLQLCQAAESDLPCCGSVPLTEKSWRKVATAKPHWCGVGWSITALLPYCLFHIPMISKEAGSPQLAGKTLRVGAKKAGSSRPI